MTILMILMNKTVFPPVTQLVEYETFNFGVAGSNPAGGTLSYTIFVLACIFLLCYLLQDEEEM